MFQALDLYYYEQRCSGWGGIAAYANADSAFPIYPFSHRRIIASQFMLDPHYRKRGQQAVDLIQRNWPALLSIPFSQSLSIGTKLKGMVRWHLSKA